MKTDLVLTVHHGVKVKVANKNPTTVKRELRSGVGSDGANKRISDHHRMGLVPRQE